MTELQIAILNKIQELDDNQQQQVLDFLDTLKPKSFDSEAWWRAVEEFHAKFVQTHGQDYYVGVQSLLDEVREESSWLP